MTTRLMIAWCLLFLQTGNMVIGNRASVAKWYQQYRVFHSTDAIGSVEVANAARWRFFGCSRSPVQVLAVVTKPRTGCILWPTDAEAVTGSASDVGT